MKPNKQTHIPAAELLAILRQHDGLGTVDIAATAGMDASNCSKALRRLESAGDIFQLADGRWVLNSSNDPDNVVALMEGDDVISISLPPMIATAIHAHFKPSKIRVNKIRIELGVSNEK